MRICLSGAQSTGKSTLLKLIENKGFFSDYTFLQEVIRKLMEKEKIHINRDYDHKSQMKIFEEHYLNILKYKNFISDRCAIDAFTYATLGFMNNQFSLTEHKEHKRVFEVCLPYYDHIFLFPIEFAPSEDSVRDTDIAFQKAIQDVLLHILEEYHIDYHRLSGTLEERKKQFITFFNHLTRRKH